jgi:hypothetical protein
MLADLINDMLSHMKAERTKEHGWPWVFGKLLQSLMLQKDLLSMVKDLVGQEDSGMMGEVTPISAVLTDKRRVWSSPPIGVSISRGQSPARYPRSTPSRTGAIDEAEVDRCV